MTSIIPTASLPSTFCRGPILSSVRDVTKADIYRLCHLMESCIQMDMLQYKEAKHPKGMRVHVDIALCTATTNKHLQYADTHWPTSLTPEEFMTWKGSNEVIVHKGREMPTSLFSWDEPWTTPEMNQWTHFLLQSGFEASHVPTKLIMDRCFITTQV